MTNMSIIIDPLDHHTLKNAYELLNACGRLIPWSVIAMEAAENNGSNLTDVMDALYTPNRISHSSSFDMENFDWSTGIYKHPNDPVSFPIVSMSCGEQKVYIYQSAFITWWQPDFRRSWFYTRMDG